MASKINERLKMYRLKFSCSKREMASLLGLKYTTYCRMEDKGNITGDCLLKISEVLCIDVRRLLYDEIPKDNFPTSPSEPETSNNKNEKEEKERDASIPVMESLILKQLKKLSLNDQQEIFDIILDKILNKRSTKR